jgi:hypothetical protein
MFGRRATLNKQIGISGMEFNRQAGRKQKSFAEQLRDRDKRAKGIDVYTILSLKLHKFRPSTDTKRYVVDT